MDRAEYLRLQKLIEPCLTPEDLDEFLQTYLKIELPWDTVDELSTSAPLQFIWEVNKTLLTGKGAHRHVLAAARNTTKTLSSAIIQFIGLLHFRRDANHLAATISQSAALINYMDQFMRLPELATYQKTDNVRQKRFVDLPPNDYTTKDNAALQVITASKKGTNSTRCLTGNTSVIVYDKKTEKLTSFCIKEIHKKIINNEDVYVLSVCPETLTYQINRVTQSIRSINRERIELYTHQNKTLRSTRDHMHASGLKNGKLVYRRADQFKIGDFLIKRNYDGKLEKDYIKNIHIYTKKNKKNIHVYDITVDNAHNFFANGILTHNCSLFTADEVDLIPPGILSEAAFILDPTRDGHRFDPISIYLSSRKTNSGPVQELIDEAESVENRRSRTPVTLHKWSMVDFMQHCPDEVSLKNEGSQQSYIHQENLQTIWTADEFEAVPDNRKAEYDEVTSYPGCRDCPAWIACQGRSVNQRGLSPMLRTPTFVGGILQNVKDPGQIVAQALNWKPESTGLVFRMFTPHHHIKDHRDFYEWVSFGEIYNPDDLPKEEIERIENTGNYKEISALTPTKEQIYEQMIKHGWDMKGGVDFGHSPDPAVCVVLGYHKKRELVAVLHIENAFGYANHVWAEYCAENIFNRFPVDWVGPDTADKSAPSYFAKHGIRSLKTKPPRIDPGVSYIRGMMWDAGSNISRFAILDDSGTESKNSFMIEELGKYAHARDASGKIQKDKFLDENNHSIDATRYALDPISRLRTIRASSEQNAAAQTDQELRSAAIANDPAAQAVIAEKNKAMNQYAEFMRSSYGVNVSAKPVIKDGKPVKSKSSIKFSI